MISQRHNFFVCPTFFMHTNLTLPGEDRSPDYCLADMLASLLYHDVIFMFELYLSLQILIILFEFCVELVGIPPYAWE